MRKNKGLGLAALGLVGLLGVNSCKINEDAAYGLLLGGWGRQENKPGVAAVGDGMVQLSAAERGKTQVNVNVNEGNGQNRSYHSGNSFIVATHKKNDLDRDNLYTDEKVFFDCIVRNRSGGKLFFDLYKIESSGKKMVDSYDEWETLGEASRRWLKYEQGFPSGTYLAVWRIEDEQLHSRAIEVKERR